MASGGSAMPSGLGVAAKFGNGSDERTGVAGRGNERAERAGGASTIGSGAHRFTLSVHQGGEDGGPGYFVPDADELQAADWEHQAAVRAFFDGWRAVHADRGRRNAWVGDFFALGYPSVALSLFTGSNVWQSNAPGDDSIQAVTLLEPFVGLRRVGVTGPAAGGILSTRPELYVASRVTDLRAAMPANSRGYITMGVAVAEDANGARVVLISTSEPRGYLRPGVTLKPGEVLVRGTGHAEADIVSFAQASGYRVISIGATRPVCASCQNAISTTPATTATAARR